MAFFNNARLNSWCKRTDHLKPLGFIAMGVLEFTVWAGVLKMELGQN